MPRKLMTNEELKDLICRLDSFQHVGFTYKTKTLEQAAHSCASHLFTTQHKESSDVNKFRKQMEFLLKHGKFKTEEDMG